MTVLFALHDEKINYLQQTKVDLISLVFQMQGLEAYLDIILRSLMRKLATQRTRREIFTEK